MRNYIKTLSFVTVAVLVGGRSFGQPSWPDLVFEPVVTDLVRPVDIAHAGDGSNRLFIVEQRGRIQCLRGAQLTEFLDIADRVQDRGNEQGFLGLAFSPFFSVSGNFYVNYTSSSSGRNGDTVISRFRLDAGAESADPDSEEVLLVIDQPFANHNGGQILFGPDGLLYIGMGDGGSGRDPGERAQDLSSLLGKLLRIDVETPANGAVYGIPPDNPFVGQVGIRAEIWAFGLRNPWRFAFDRSTDDLYIGDVGQVQLEEIDFQAAQSGGGENYGWDFYEGNVRQTSFNSSSPPAQSSLTFPIFEYGRSLGISVTGGRVYRGRRYPRMHGVYFFGDFGSGRIWGTQGTEGGEWSTVELSRTGFGISTFGEDEAGNLYLADLDGTLYQINDDYVWADATDLGDGWKRSAWLGQFNDGEFPWVFHEDHGWWLTEGENQTGLWFFSSDLGWIWTGSESYPFLFRASDEGWLFYLEGSRNPRWFFNFGAGEWEMH